MKLLAPGDYAAAYWRAYELDAVTDDVELSVLRAHAEHVRQTATLRYRDTPDMILRRRHVAVSDAAALTRSRSRRTRRCT